MDDFQIIQKIYNAFDPSRPLEPGDSAYVNCQEVRGDSNIEKELGKKILFAKVTEENDDSTCQLYGGHRGAGKTTELLRLKKYLENKDCFVVYFSADRDIDPEDTQYTDILLACTRYLLEELKDNNPDPILNWLRDRWNSLKELSLTKLDLDSVNVKTGITTFAQITANLKAVPSQRAKIRKLVYPHTTTLLKAINEFIHEAKNQLPLGKKKLVIIADSLDRIAINIQEDGRSNHDHIFIDRSQQLKGLNCHVIYTVPISLLYSNRANDIYDNYGNTQILPMIKVVQQDGVIYEEGFNKIKEVIAKRVEKATPNINFETQIFEKNEDLKRLCLMSGGHIRQLIQLIQEAISESDSLPINSKAVKRSIAKSRDVYARTVNEKQWDILAEVAVSKELKNQAEYRDLLFSRCLLEYVDFNDEEFKRWCDVHPLIKDIPKFKIASQKITNSEDESKTS